MLEKILTQNGLTDKEARIYVATLAAGEGTVASVARRAEVERTTVYNLLEKMQQDGLISIMKRRGIQYLSALPPRVLIDRFKSSAVLAEQALPEFLEIAFSSPLKPRVRFYDGISGLKQILREFGHSEYEKLLFTDYATMPPELARFILKEIVPLNRRTGMPRCIAVQNEISKKIARQHTAPHRFVRYSEKGQELELLLFDRSKAAFLSFASEEQFGVIIDSLAIHRMLRNLFFFIWEQAKPL